MGLSIQDAILDEKQDWAYQILLLRDDRSPGRGTASWKTLQEQITQ